MNTLPSNKGFTLLELLVALAIFSLVSVTIHSSLTSMIATKEHLATDSRQLRALQTAWRIIGRDIEQAVNRPVRSEYDEELPALHWTYNPQALALTTNGRRNPAGLIRSSLQRVSFRLEDSTLIKDSWPVLDRGVDTKPFSKTLVEDIESFDVSFIDENEKVLRNWPPEDQAAGADAPQLPRAVNIQLELKDWGKVDRLFLIGGKG
jgi:general secretion pathway protein J